MVFSLQDKWLWDSWYVHDGELWHGYFLEADRAIGDPELRHWHVSYHHAVSSNLKDWRSLGTCFMPSPGPAWDDYTTWTGSIVRGDDERWHLFYTGSSHAEDSKKQRIGHAVSDDLHRFERVGDGLVLDLAPPYEEFHIDRWHDRAFRDPWVIRDPDGDGWLMYFTARKAGVDNTREAGCIGFATSPDLYRWNLQEPVFTGGFGELEVPQVFAYQGRWYCLFCTSAVHWGPSSIALLGQPKVGTHYLLGDSPRGPWRIAPPPLLDMASFPRRYAGRVVEYNDTLQLLGFHWFEREGGEFVGTISDPTPLHVDASGLLLKTREDDEHG